MIRYLDRDQSVLAAICGSLLVFLAYETLAPVATYEIPVVDLDHPLPKAATAPAFSPASIGTFWEIDARPVFNPSRTPIKVATDATKNPSAPPEITAVLNGV